MDFAEESITGSGLAESADEISMRSRPCETPGCHWTVQVDYKSIAERLLWTYHDAHVRTWHLGCGKGPGGNLALCGAEFRKSVMCGL